MAKRKRAPGQGRKPSGPISGKSSVFTSRIRPETREAIEAEAKANGWSMSQAAERILLAGIDTLRERNTVQPTQALRMLVGIIADESCIQPKSRQYEWWDDQFIFDAFRIALMHALEKLRPTRSILAGNRDQLDHPWPHVLSSPEAFGDFVFVSVWDDLVRIKPTSILSAQKELGVDEQLGAVWSRHTQTLEKIRRDLKIPEREK